MSTEPKPAGAPGAPVTTRTCELWLEAGLLRGRFLPNAEVVREDAVENLAVSARLTGGRRLPVLIDLRQVRSQSAEARAELAGPASARVASAVALLIGSPLSRVLGNFYLRFNRPQTPTRLFSSEAEAAGWLARWAATAPGQEDPRHGDA